MTKINSKSKIFFKLIILILALYFLYFVGSIFYERNFIKNEINLTEEKDEQTELEKLKNRPPINTEISSPKENPELDNSDDKSESNNFERESQLEISRNDCDNQCKNYTEISKLEYCKQVCGLISMEKTKGNENSKADDVGKACEEFIGIKKDYCWRDQAIDETNFEKCKKIKDGNVYKQCKNRITEDIADSQF